MISCTLAIAITVVLMDASSTSQKHSLLLGGATLFRASHIHLNLPSTKVEENIANKVEGTHNLKFLYWVRKELL